MTTPNTPTKQTLHPLMIIAAVAVVLFCGVGTAAIMGWLPTSNANGGVPGAATMPGQLSSVPPTEQQPVPAYNNAAINGNANSLAANGNAGRDADNNAAGRDQDRAPEPEVKQAAVCKSCGVVESVRSIEHRPQGSGVGAAGGAILGGLLGNQVGGGSGRQVATVAGAVGGGYAGNEIEKRARSSTVTDVRVRMSDGSVRTFTEAGGVRRHSGARVKVVKGALVANR